MAATRRAPDWPAHVIAFLSSNLPRFDDGGGWDHVFLTAYQIGCDALVALGQAEATDCGAVPREDARLPDVLPRWDDLCIAVLGLADQQQLLSYRRHDGSVPPSGTSWFVAPASEPPRPNIDAAHGLGPAHATSEVLAVLEALGLVAEGSWTDVAETVLWRDQPTAWQLDVKSDLRFCEAVEKALATIPDGIRAEMHGIVTVTDEDIATAMKQSVKAWALARAELGPKVRVTPPWTTGQARSALEFRRKRDLDWLFYRHWRLDDGWLVADEARRALKIFHDPLATAMQRAVTRRLYPSLPFLGDMPRNT